MGTSRGSITNAPLCPPVRYSVVFPQATARAWRKTNRPGPSMELRGRVMSEPSSVQEAVQRVSDSLERVEHTARIIEIPALQGREWYEVLSRKLRPQLG